MCTPRQLGILLISQYLCICLLGIPLLVHIHLQDCRETADSRTAHQGMMTAEGQAVAALTA